MQSQGWWRAVTESSCVPVGESFDPMHTLFLIPEIPLAPFRNDLSLVCYILQCFNAWFSFLYEQLQIDKYMNKQSDICVSEDMYLRTSDGIYFPFMLSNNKCDFPKKINFYFYPNMFYFFNLKFPSFE